MVLYERRTKKKHKLPKDFRPQFDDSKPKRTTKSQHFRNRVKKLIRQQKAGLWRSQYIDKPVKIYKLSDAPLNYPEYLAGPYWKKLRKQILWHRNVCEKCGIDRCLNLHHRYYYRDGRSVLYRERDFADVFEVLCRRCHARTHGVDSFDK